MIIAEFANGGKEIGGKSGELPVIAGLTGTGGAGLHHARAGSGPA